MKWSQAIRGPMHCLLIIKPLTLAVDCKDNYFAHSVLRILQILLSKIKIRGKKTDAWLKKDQVRDGNIGVTVSLIGNEGDMLEVAGIVLLHHVANKGLAAVSVSIVELWSIQGHGSRPSTADSFRAARGRHRQENNERPTACACYSFLAIGASGCCFA